MHPTPPRPPPSEFGISIPADPRSIHVPARHAHTNTHTHTRRPFYRSLAPRSTRPSPDWRVGLFSDSLPPLCETWAAADPTRVLLRGPHDPTPRPGDRGCHWIGDCLPRGKSPFLLLLLEGEKGGNRKHGRDFCFVFWKSHPHPPTYRLWKAERDSQLAIRECARVTGCEAFSCALENFLGPAECFFRLCQRSISLSHVHKAVQSAPTRGL